MAHTDKFRITEAQAKEQRMGKQMRPLHPPTRVTLAVEGTFPGFPPDTIRVEPHLGTFALLRDGAVLATGQLSSEQKAA